MPSNVTAKIKSVPRSKIWKWVGLVVVVVILGMASRFFFMDVPPVTDYDGKQYTLKRGEQTLYRLTSAHSSDAQQKGLSDTLHLDQDRGMLFWYDHMAERCFWMKDMRYALDIVWLDGKKKVLHIERNLTPQSYPQAYCTVSQYVIELNTGEANKSKITVGEVLSF